MATALAASVGAVAAWATTPALPQPHRPEHAQRAIDSCNRCTGAGLRDRAVPLLPARLGLRAHEIIALQLEDGDRDGGHLRVRSKRRREQLLPITADVGAAIAADPAAGATPEPRPAFVLTVDGADSRIDAGTHMLIGTIVRHALQRAGVDAPHRGSHQIATPWQCVFAAAGCFVDRDRRVFAHQSPQMTSIYARVDIGALRPLAQPWPAGVRDEHPA